MIAQLGPAFQTTGHKGKTHGIIPSSGLKRRGIEIVQYLSDAARSRNLVIDVIIASPTTEAEVAQIPQPVGGLGADGLDAEQGLGNKSAR